MRVHRRELRIALHELEDRFPTEAVAGTETPRDFAHEGEVVGGVDAPAVVREVGLAGEVRQVGHLGQRLNEASRLGFTHAIVPASAPDIKAGIAMKRASTLNEAIALAGLTSAS